MENTFVEQLQKIENELTDLKKRVTNIEDALHSSPAPQKIKGLSINEFLLEKNPKTDRDKTLTIGYYLEIFEQLTEFTIHDLEGGFSRTKELRPKNINLAVIGNIQNGYMMENKGMKNKKKSWSLTNKGTEVVKNGFKEKS